LLFVSPVMRDKPCERANLGCRAGTGIFITGKGGDRFFHYIIRVETVFASSSYLII